MSQDDRQSGKGVADLVSELGYARGEPTSWKESCVHFEVKSEELQVARFVHGHGRVTRIEGTCPACGHQLSKEISPLAQGALFAPPKPAAEVRAYLVTCNCVNQHPGAPEGVRGCGAQGGVTITPKEGGGAVGYAELTVEQRDADEWAERARSEQLPRVRALAAQWVATWGVIASLITFGTIFDASKKDYELSPAVFGVFVVLASLALAAAVLAAVFAAQAAGTRELDDIPADVDGRVEVQAKMIAYCRSRLTLSKTLALCSVLLIAGALYLRFFGGA